MMDSIQQQEPRRGRPPIPEDKKLRPYGLHLSPDKIKKMTVVKNANAETVREYLEGHIERDYQNLVRRGVVKSDEWQHVKSDEPKSKSA